MTESAIKPTESKAEAESLLANFQLTKVLNQDQAGRRITLLGTIDSKNSLLTLERASFPSEASDITSLLRSFSNLTNLGANDIYRWYMSNITSSSLPDIKVNLIWPCTESHIRKYTAQQLRWITETPEIYSQHIKPWIERTQRGKDRLEWIYNILDGITEQEDVVYRSSSTRTTDGTNDGFLLLPDLNWDRRTVSGLHLLALVERRDLWTSRSLKKRDVKWLRHLKQEIVEAAARVAQGLGEHADSDQFKCYVHYQPTYYHFHVHVVHVMLEAGATQAVGKAFALDNLIGQLEGMEGSESGMDGVEVSYFLGEESELWKKCFSKLKMNEDVVLNS